MGLAGHPGALSPSPPAKNPMELSRALHAREWVGKGNLLGNNELLGTLHGLVVDTTRSPDTQSSPRPPPAHVFLAQCLRRCCRTGAPLCARLFGGCLPGGCVHKRRRGEQRGGHGVPNTASSLSTSPLGNGNLQLQDTNDVFVRN